MDGVLTKGLITLSLFLQVLSSGIFEMAVISILNGNGRRSNGRCCFGSDNVCSGECRTFVTACLLQQTTVIPEIPDCIFGNASSTVLGGNIINETTLDSSDVLLQIRFEFLWPALFTLVVNARHDNDLKLSQNDSSQIIISSVLSEALYPPSLWYIKTTIVSDKSIQYRYRVLCDENYYGAGCEVFCRHRNDSFGHYICDQHGNKLCLPGWEGEFCQNAMCWDRCNMSHGFCNEPFQCSCLIGWEGESCDQCMRYPQCTNGYCYEPGQCICQDGWGGIYCNIDLAYCQKYEPCEHDGTCIPDGNKNFTCQCTSGFTGVNCESQACSSGYCKNGGSCSESSIGCECPKKYYGEHCEFRRLTCEETDCMNGGTCISTPTGTFCNCSRGFTGENCKSEINECQSNPCQYGGLCKDIVGGYICECRDGYMGNNCDMVIDPCLGIACFHNGTCVTSPSGFSGSCACPPGITGHRCEIVLDPCINIECQNGGTCTSVTNNFDFQCKCATGYNGVYCEKRADPCEFIECANGGTCKSYTNHYICICDPHFGGKHCNSELMPADQTISDNIPNNIIPEVTNGANLSTFSETIVPFTIFVILSKLWF